MVMNSPSLVHVDDKNNVIPEARYSMRSWHFDDECKEIVNESVEGLVNKEMNAIKNDLIDVCGSNGILYKIIP